MVSQGAGGPARSKSMTSVVRPDPRTGRLVRGLVAAPHSASRAATPTVHLSETVERVARENQLPPQLIHSVIQAESNYDPYAVSRKGAQGLMQLIPSTARRFGVSDVFDPAENIQGGAKYLKYLLELYKGDHELALAAYNAGEGAVSRYGGVPPFPETRGYVAKVSRNLDKATASNETGTQPSSVKAIESSAKEANPAEGHNPIQEVMGADGKVYYISPDMR